MHGQMPLVTFEPGALFTLNPDLFHIGQRPEDFQPSDSTVICHESSSYSFVPYYFKATFERPTQYLAVPFSVIRNIVAGLNISTNTGCRFHT